MAMTWSRYYTGTLAPYLEISSMAMTWSRYPMSLPPYIQVLYRYYSAIPGDLLHGNDMVQVLYRYYSFIPGDLLHGYDMVEVAHVTAPVLRRGRDSQQTHGTFTCH